MAKVKNRDLLCCMEGCARRVYASGWCELHYQRERSGWKPKPVACSVDGCGRKPKTRSLCAMHYQRRLRHGSPGDATPVKAGRGQPTLLHCGKDQCPAGLKLVMHLYYLRHQDKLKQKAARWVARRETAAPGAIKAQKAARYQANAEAVKAQVKAWVRDNPERARANSARRHRRVKQATPPWVDWSAIDAIYATCPKGWHVDHIIPLRHPFVSGLHVPANLQHLPASVNCSKRNTFDPGSFARLPADTGHP